MKTIMEIFKLATRLNIKPKDVIGMGGDIVKMGQSLFNTKINPKLTLFSNARSAEMESGSRENLSFLFNGCVVSSRGSLLERQPVP